MFSIAEAMLMLFLISIVGCVALAIYLPSFRSRARWENEGNENESGDA